MVRTNIFEDSECRKVVAQRGCFSLIEYERDISVTPGYASTAYYSSMMNIRKRQVVANLSGGGIIVQAGAMQWTAGNVDVATNVKGAGDFVKKQPVCHIDIGRDRNVIYDYQLEYNANGTANHRNLLFLDRTS